MVASYLVIALVMVIVVLSVIYLRNITREFRGRDRGTKPGGGDGAPLVMLSSDDGGGDGGGD
jgi:hypothetical protein